MILVKNNNLALPLFELVLYGKSGKQLKINFKGLEELCHESAEHWITCNGIIRLSMMAVVNVFIRVSTALCLRQTRVNAVPISFDAPKKEKSLIKVIDLKRKLNSPNSFLMATFH